MLQPTYQGLLPGIWRALSDLCVGRRLGLGGGVLNVDTERSMCMAEHASSGRCMPLVSRFNQAEAGVMTSETYFDGSPPTRVLTC